jgi:Class II flagellar assembly regulator
MRVYRPTGSSSLTSGAPARRATSGTFSLGSGEQSRAPTPAAAPRTIGGIDALMALQGVENPTERRRRAVKRGRNALDALDALKLGMLAGTLDGAALARLKAATAGLGEATGEPGLDTVLAEIALRAEVELAKVGMPQSEKNIPNGPVVSSPAAEP